MNENNSNNDVNTEVIKNNINENIAYQDGSIISKILLKKKNGNVTLFAFDQDQELTEHTSSHEALIHVVEGQVEISIDGKPILLIKGEYIVLPANHPHSVKAKTKMKMILIMIKD